MPGDRTQNPRIKGCPVGASHGLYLQLQPTSALTTLPTLTGRRHFATAFAPPPSTAEPTVFRVFMERPGVNLEGWQGESADGTTFVGRIPLAQGAGTPCVVALQVPPQPGELRCERPSDAAQLRQVRDPAATGPVVITVIGELSDGAVALIDLRADERVLATLDSALE